MELIRSLDKVQAEKPSNVTIGVFDGVHRGHQHLIGSMVQSSRDSARKSVVVTFDPHPGALLGRSPVAILSTIEERAEVLADIGVDLLVVQPFTPTVAGTRADQFIGRVVGRLKMAELWVGSDFALGHRREGDVQFLQRLGRQEGFEVVTVEPMVWKGSTVSSTRIRAALTAGDVEGAAQCLGRSYSLSGQVVRGQGLGRKLGFPTANLDLSPAKLVPANGVYACIAHVGSECWRAVANVGVRPTVGVDGLVVEAHLLRFSGDLYGTELRLEFISRLRDEERFESLDDLTTQIARDIELAEQVLKSSSG